MIRPFIYLVSDIVSVGFFLRRALRSTSTYRILITMSKAAEVSFYEGGLHWQTKMR